VAHPSLTQQIWLCFFIYKVHPFRKEMMEVYEEVVNHVMNKMGDFNIDGWKIKSPVEE